MGRPDTVPKRFQESAELHPELPAVYFKDNDGEFQPISYSDFFRDICILGTGLMKRGIKRGNHVGIISDNRREWLLTDMALLGFGAVDVPRGSDSTAKEIHYILQHAECSTCFAENSSQAEKILQFRSELPHLKTLILFDEGDVSKDFLGDVELLNFKTLMEESRKAYGKDPKRFLKELEKGESSDLATLIYTSGTTGEPKGVMLSHESFLFQLDRIYEYLAVEPGHIFLSVLPVWHSFERAVEYIIINRGATIAYSKPVGAVMLPDMQKIRPHWLTSVPRIWESVRAAVYRNINKEGGIKKGLFTFFVSVGEMRASMADLFWGRMPNFHGRNRIVDKALAVLPWALLTPLTILGNLLVFGKIKAKLGGRFIAGISGGGALPPYVDRFFQAAGISLLEGYGLTETGPILSVRKQSFPVPHTVGPLLPDVEYRVIGKNDKLMPPGRKGTLYVKSPQVMMGYYKRPEATAEVLRDGWLNTGDVCRFTHNREFKILGRSKETIVLTGGENIEPTPIEERLNSSEAILQSMVVGQDKKYLGALIVPDQEKLVEYAQSRNISYFQSEDLLGNPEIQEYIHNEIQAAVNPKNGFKHFECIFRFTLLSKPFEVGEELTQTLKIKRARVFKGYKHEIEELFS